MAAILAAALGAPGLAQGTGAQALAEAMAAVARKDWPAAEAQSRIAGPLAFDIVEWHRLRAGEGRFADYADFAARRANWPGMPLLRRKGEAVLDEGTPEQIVAYFSGQAPLTGAGALALIAAYQSMGEATKAQTVAEAAWRELDLSAEDQATFLERHAAWVTPHHGGRMQTMLDRTDLTQARRMLDLVTPGTKTVAAARIALQARTAGVDALIEAIPERMLGSYGLARDRAVWRWRMGFEDGAADLILERSESAAHLGDPALWADVRARMARWDLRNGNPRRAYKIAARHRLSDHGSDYADLEWLAGYAALKLGDAPTALRHFEAMGDVVASPISSSRAAYWQGRALEQMGQMGPAKAAFAEGARWQTAYYGLLSAERLGQPLDPALSASPALPDWRGQPFEQSSVFQAALLLREAGQDALAERFLLHLEESLPPEQIAPLAALALDWRDTHLALRLGKRAASDGVVLVPAYYPIPDLTTHDLGVPEELVLAIARRESEFDHRVVSHAGAMGLMQVMPGTAKMMAEEIGEPYQEARLTTDATYNARLGGAYLRHLREEFGPSIVLVAAGYNAGPGRPRRWMTEMGDPRVGTVDVVDWVEMIPFDETRNYVMRVAESLPVYRARLGLPAVKFTTDLRGVAR